MATPRELFDAFFERVLRSDGEGLAALCTEDVVMELPFSKVRFCGRADVCDRVSLAWRDTHQQVTDIQYVRISDAGNVLVAEFDLVGYIDGRPFRAGAVQLLETRAGKIAALRAYVEPGRFDSGRVDATLAAP